MIKTIRNWFQQYFMKSHLIEALRADLAATLATNNELHIVISALATEVRRLDTEREPWWQAEDDELVRRAQEVQRMEEEEHVNEVDVSFEADATKEAIDQSEDIPF